MSSTSFDVLGFLCLISSPLQESNERYLVLFPHTVLMLSASLRMSGFIYQVHFISDGAQIQLLVFVLEILSGLYCMCVSAGEDASIRNAHI